MRIKEWYSSSSGNQTIRLGQSYDNKQSRYDIKTQQGWLAFWRKIKKTKKKNFKDIGLSSSSSMRLQATTYDPTTYSKNFDQGMGWAEPDNLSRSFSARFADPSRIFPKSIVLLD
ncbi:hypothetical protein TorRG33x02_002090 [Trema orientale]|uniref:Uncharacterized protein n=1 Tax=Trema orientale TaxID=63057 RepID=A0A2P5G1J7_TREOI|nr:hypothetical protein TorRG33x02_002090 [Trema orientale]